MFGDPDASFRRSGARRPNAQARLDYQPPERCRADGSLGVGREPRPVLPRRSTHSASANVLDEPGIVQLTLPDESGPRLLAGHRPARGGRGRACRPRFEDTNLAARLVTWLRITAPSGGQAKLIWAGINAAAVTQQARVADEMLPAGTGAPDQVVGSRTTR